MGEDGFEALYSAEGHEVGLGGVGACGYGFGSVVDYIDVRQCKCAGYFAEERGFFVIRFDECQMEVRGPDL